MEMVTKQVFGQGSREETAAKREHRQGKSQLNRAMKTIIYTERRRGWGLRAWRMQGDAVNDLRSSFSLPCLGQSGQGQCETAQRFAGSSLALALLPVWAGLILEMRTEHSAGGCTASAHKQNLQRKSFPIFQIFTHRSPFGNATQRNKKWAV